MKEPLITMLNIYDVKDIDWMGYKVSKDNPYTYHHIVKRCHKGKRTIENGAILTKLSHQYLHIIESRDLEIYEYLNNILKQINEQGFNVLERQLLAIDFILKQFEEEYKNETTSKGKILIKNEYTDRVR